MSSTRAERAKEIACEIWQLYRDEKYDDRSTRWVRSAVARYPESPDVALEAAEYCYWKDAKLTKSAPQTESKMASHERRYRRAIELAPSWAAPWERLAFLFDVSRKFDEGAVAARKAINLGHGPDAMALLARILAQQNKRSQALRWARDPRVTRSSSEYARTMAAEVRRGEWFEPDEDKERENELRRAIRRNPRSSAAWLNLAHFFDLQGRLDDAAIAARKAVRYGGADAIAILARVLAQQGRKAEALGVLKSPKLARSKSKSARTIAQQVENGDWFPRKRRRRESA